MFFHFDTSLKVLPREEGRLGADGDVAVEALVAAALDLAHAAPPRSFAPRIR